MQVDELRATDGARLPNLDSCRTLDLLVSANGQTSINYSVGDQVKLTRYLRTYVGGLDASEHLFGKRTQYP